MIEADDCTFLFFYGGDIGATSGIFGIMEKKMGTTIMGYIGSILGK